MSERDIRALLALVERHLGKSWIEISDYLRGIDANSLDEIEARLTAGDIPGVVKEVESAARRFAAEAHSQFVRSGQAASKWLDSEIPDRLIRFDAVNERAVIAARRNELELVQGLSEETRVMARQVIVDGQRAGLNPREIARDIRDSITLTPNQAQHVQNYRRALQQGDWSNALGRELSDGNADRTVARLQRDGGALTESQIDAMVERYRQNYVNYRAETISRTESLRNVHAGLDEAMRQAVARGDVDADQLVKEWIHAGRGKDSRSDHIKMDGVQVRHGEDFVLPSGKRMRWPGDPLAGADETANCRCTFATTLA